jgi:hypothetical protein
MKSPLSKRFEELITEAQAIETTSKLEENGFGGADPQVERLAFLKWTVNANNLIPKACGADSPHMSHFIEASKGSMFSTFHKLQRMRIVLSAAQEDFQGGYLASAHDLVRADVFGSELEQASELLKCGYAVAAAVIAGTVLETHIRELCRRNNIGHGKLEKMNADLVKAGVYSSIVQKRITHLAAVRNAAAHGNHTEFKAYDIAAMISGIEQLLTSP